MFDLWRYCNPVQIESGGINCLADLIKGNKVLLVTTKGCVERGVASEIIKLLKPREILVWDGVKKNPDLQSIENAIVKYHGLGINVVVGVGGGSAIDSAKIIRTAINKSDLVNLIDLIKRDDFGSDIPKIPLVVVPTTSGTGADVTPFATIWDYKHNKKLSVAGQDIYPDICCLDASLTLTLGFDDTLYPALDTISHALESLWNKKCNPITRSLAYQALNLSNEALPQILSDLKNIKLRQKLQVAGTLAGLAISQTTTALAHAISYPLTIHYGVPHGLACSFSLEAILVKNISNICQNDLEMSIIKEVIKILSKLNLKSRVIEHTGSANLLKFKDEILSNNRFKSYFGADINLDDILSLNA